MVPRSTGRPRVPLAATALVALAAIGLVALASRSRGAPVPRPVAMGADGLPAEIPRPGSPRPTAAEWDAAPRPIRTFGEPPLACEARMVREWLRVSCATKGALEPKAVATTVPNGHEEHVGLEGGVATFVVRVVRGTTWRGRVVYATQRVPEMFAILADWPARDARPGIGYQDEPILE